MPLPSKPKAKSNSHQEHDEQKKLVLFVTNHLMHEYPVLRWLHAIPNGVSYAELDKMLNGKAIRYKITTQMISEGVKSGVCDLFLPVRSKEMVLTKVKLSQEQKIEFCLDVDEVYSLAPRYSGLYIEMKSKTGTVSIKQKEFIAFVREQGFKVVVPRSADEALAEIVSYCGLPENIRLNK
jgi:hypothetical protein